MRADLAAAAGAAIAIVAVSFTHGGYFPREWGWAMLAFALAALFAILVRDEIVVSPYEIAAVLLLFAFAGWTALSIVWSPSAAQPVLATQRALVYATALPALLLVARRRSGEWLVAGVVTAAVAVCAYALAGRLVPGTLTSYPPTDSYQLQEPIGYWNGLAILATIGALCAAVASAEARARLGRGAAAAVLPVLATTLYLTFSRGGLLALALGLAVAVGLSRARLHLLVVLAALAPATLVAVWFTSRRHALTHAGAALATARSQGWRAGVVIVLCIAVSAAVGAALLPELERRIRVGERARRGATAALVGLIAVAVLAVLVREGGPVALASRVSHSFTSSVPATGGDLNRRLTSFSGDGRADYWRVAWRQVRAHPLLGAGAGSYERYWLRYRPTSYDTQNAHNLYLETLAELGPLGLALIVGAFAVPLAAAVRFRGRGGVTAAGAAFAAYAAHATLDWDFQIVAVTVAALACAAAVLVASRADRRARVLPTRARFAAAGACAALVVVAIAIQVGNSALSDGSDALDRGDVGRAVALGNRARRWQPWSYQPWQLLGEAALAARRPAEARRLLQEALARDPSNAGVWADLALASRGPARAHALAEARRLDPRGA